MKNSTLTFKERNSIPFKNGEHTKSIYDVYMDGKELEDYTLTVTNEGPEKAEYRLYSQLVDSDTQLVIGFYDLPNFPSQSMDNLYSSIQK